MSLVWSYNFNAIFTSTRGQYGCRSGRVIINSCSVPSSISFSSPQVIFTSTSCPQILSLRPGVPLTNLRTCKCLTRWLLEEVLSICQSTSMLSTLPHGTATTDDADLLVHHWHLTYARGDFTTIIIAMAVLHTVPHRDIHSGLWYLEPHLRNQHGDC